MASPQKENGYTPIANEIVERFCETKYRLSGDEWTVLWIILRKTYGWNKTEDAISLSQFAKISGIKRQNVHRALKKLSSKKIIVVIKNDDRKPVTYSFNKNYEKWVLSSKLITVIKKDDKPVIKIDSSLSSKLIPTKETITKDIIKDNITEQVKTLLGLFGNNLQNKAEVYLSRVSVKNKSGVITEGRKITLLTELLNSRERAGDDNMFGYALDQAIGRDACNIGYINAIIKNKKTKKPSEYREYHAPAKLS